MDVLYGVSAVSGESQQERFRLRFALHTETSYNLSEWILLIAGRTTYDDGFSPRSF